MFRKIEVWILYLTILFGLLFAVVFGILVRQELVGSTKFGVVSKTALFLTEIPVNIKKIYQENGLKVKDRFVSLTGFNGKENTEVAYLLLSRRLDDESIVELIDLKNFQVLHTWNPDIDKMNSKIPQVENMAKLDRDGNNKRATLLHPQLTSDGGLLFLDMALRKIDKCSNLLYQNFDQIYHHSIELDLQGNIWVPIHRYPSSLPAKKVGSNTKEDNGFLDDTIVKISPNGDIMYQKSVPEIFIENNLEYLLFSIGKQTFNRDPIHLNDIQTVNFDGPFWKKGDLFLSFRAQSMVILYRPEINKIIWKGTGPFFHQHDVDILNDHQIAIFNNNSKDFFNGELVDGNNEIVIYNFSNNKFSTYLSDSLIDQEVRTITQGRSEILPNGNLFVEESNYGRILYFNTDGTLRWTYVNRTKTGKVRALGWSRILHSSLDISLVKKFLKERTNCEN